MMVAGGTQHHESAKAESDETPLPYAAIRVHPWLKLGVSARNQLRSARQPSAVNGDGVGLDVVRCR